MANTERLLLLFLVTASNELNVNARVAVENSLGLISKLLGKGFQYPLVVYIKNAHSKSNTFLRTSVNQNHISVPEESAIPFNNVKDAKKALRYMDEILRSTGDESNPINVKFRSALRSQCGKYIECQVKCKPKKKDNCKKSCQQVYDHLKMCGSSKDKWPQKTNKEVYEYHKKNPPNKKKKDSCEDNSDECKSKSDDCEDDDDECKSKSDECKDDDDECKSKSDECKDNDDECKSKSDECKDSDECNPKRNECESGDSCN